MKIIPRRPRNTEKIEKHHHQSPLSDIVEY